MKKISNDLEKVSGGTMTKQQIVAPNGVELPVFISDNNRYYLDNNGKNEITFDEISQFLIENNIKD